MAEGEAIRNLTVRYKAEADPSLVSAAEAMGAAALKMQKSFEEAVKAAQANLRRLAGDGAATLAGIGQRGTSQRGANFVAGAETGGNGQATQTAARQITAANEAAAASNGRNGKAAKDAADQIVAANKRIADSAETTAARLARARQPINVPNRPTEQAVRTATGSLRANERQSQVRDRDAAKAARDAERAEEQKWDAVNKQDAKQFAARMKTIGEREKAEKKASESAAKQVTDDEKRKERAVEQAARNYEGAQARVKAANMQAVESGKMVLEGVTSLARGFVLLTAANEDDAQKMLKTLAAFEAVVQTTRGIINVVQGATKMYAAYQAAVKAAAAAQVALAAAEAVSGKAAVAGAAAGGMARTALAGGAGAVGGAATVGWGAKLAGAAGATLPYAAAAASGGLGLGTIYQTGRDIGEYGFMGGARPGSMTNWIGTQEARLAGWVGGLFGSDLMGNKRGERAEKARTQSSLSAQRGEALYERRVMEGQFDEDRRAVEREKKRRDSELAARQAGYRPEARERFIGQRETAETEMAAQEREIIAAKAEGGPMAEERQRRAKTEWFRLNREGMTAQKGQEENQAWARSLAANDVRRAGMDVGARQANVADIERQIGGLKPDEVQRKGDLEGQLSVARKAAEEAFNRQTAAVEKEKDTVHQINQERLQTAERNIQRTQEEISLRRQILDAEKERVRSAQIGVGRMTEAERAQAFRAAEKLEKGVRTTAEERQAARQLGFQKPTRLAEEADIADAQRSSRRRYGMSLEQRWGKEQLATIEENQRMAGAPGAQGVLEAHIKDERQVKVSIEMDMDRMINETSNRVLEELNKNALYIELSIQNRVQRAVQEWAEGYHNIGAAKENQRG